MNMKKEENSTVVLYLGCVSLAFTSKKTRSEAEAKPPVPKKSVTLIIDAGHGSHDPGNLNGTKGMLLEKDLNLLIKKAGHLCRRIPQRKSQCYLYQKNRRIYWPGKQSFCCQQ